ncbi:MAG: peptidoglycan editing factor PgeF [Elusimicrobiales bacterium]|nr:peptidoglycan editing factor PgeF [Elusimicrobiales bacterium]
MFNLFFSRKISSVKELNLKFPLFLLHQIHSDKIVYLKNISMINQKFEGDSIVTSIDKVCIGVKTADCVPILLLDRKQGVIAAIHSGWKGTVKRIVQKTVLFIKENFNSNVDDINVFIGPSICGKCYFVKEDVLKNFLNEFGRDFEYKKNGNVFYIDLKRLNYKMLKEVGIKDESILILDECTYCSNKSYHSFRKTKNTNNFQISYICKA